MVLADADDAATLAVDDAVGVAELGIGRDWRRGGFRFLAVEALLGAIRNMWGQSQANTRMKELSKVKDYRIGPHLWSGFTTIRPGAGVAIVGNPEQVAATLQEFIDLGCTDFCLSGYPHHEEAERFGRMVMPLFADRVTREPAPSGATR